MKKAEKIIILIAIIGLIFRLTHLPNLRAIGAMIYAISLLSLAIFYLVSRFNAFEDKNKNQNRVLSNMCGLFMSLTMIGMIFKFMHWPMAHTQLLIGIVPLPILFIVTFVLKLKQKDETLQIYYRNMLLRLGIFIIILFLFINKYNIIFFIRDKII